MKKIIGFFGVLIFAVTALAASPPLIATAVFTTKSGTVTMSLEVAATPAIREKGLMDRDHIGAYDGMVFLFPVSSNYGFWMKNTRIPLDMLFLDDSGKIRYIAPRTTPYALNTIESGTEVTSVIELAGGRAEKEGIAVGDTVALTLPKGVVIE
ncbi:MAG: DUF192 domain-containing protein [Alphaproteobacteria bacterium]|jgi:uncharacterized membrane protein (UPF0127 family)